MYIYVYGVYRLKSIKEFRNSSARKKDLTEKSPEEEAELLEALSIQPLVCKDLLQTGRKGDLKCLLY